MIAVGAWIAGFDILYALADRDFDRTAGLHSIPARFGVSGALAISALCHLITAVALVALWSVAHLGAPYLTGVVVVVALLIYEHAIVRPSDLSRLGVAFFTLNGYVSVAFFIATLVDTLAR
jgi:4-hydroxybenzoate polyprenyltransferase